MTGGVRELGATYKQLVHKQARGARQQEAGQSPHKNDRHNAVMTGGVREMGATHVQLVHATRERDKTAGGRTIAATKMTDTTLSQ